METVCVVCSWAKISRFADVASRRFVIVKIITGAATVKKICCGNYLCFAISNYQPTRNKKIANFESATPSCFKHTNTQSLDVTSKKAITIIHLY